MPRSALDPHPSALGPDQRNLLRVASRARWRAWLKRNHDREREVWLVFAKKGSGQRTVNYVEAVEEALCFGWIDTTANPLDDDCYLQRFTPRTNVRNWSAINLERFDRMVAEGKMTDAGLARRPPDVTAPKPRLGNDDPVPQFIIDALAKSPKARKTFESLAPGYRRDYLRFITEAKQEATKLRRLERAIRHLEAGHKRADVKS